MVTLPNLYTSDMKDIYDWYNCYLEGSIPVELTRRVESALLRLGKDLHDIEKKK